jgi:pseudouridine-5'-phosphate glycosidase
MNINDKIKNVLELRKQSQTAETEFQYNSIFEFRSTCFAHGVPFENSGNSLFGNNVIYYSNEKGHVIAKNMIGNGYANMRTYYSSNGELPYLVSFGFLPQMNSDYK